MLIVILLFVVVPFLSWYGTWFGRPLSDKQMAQYLEDKEKPRHTQQALEQIVDRINRHDPSAAQWYPKVVSLSENPVPQVRSAAAWAMQYDKSYEGFHSALLAMLNDEDSTVRHQSALSLVAIGDSAGRGELVSMLRFQTLRADADGKATALLREGDAFAVGGPIVRIEQANGNKVEARSTQAGRVERLSVTTGAEVREGQELAVLSPSIDQVWEALRALYVVGQLDDIPSIQHYTMDLPGMPDRVRRQAAATTEAIRSRSQPSR
jgi:biotin carboxyl carrier protein